VATNAVFMSNPVKIKTEGGGGGGGGMGGGKGETRQQIK